MKIGTFILGGLAGAAVVMMIQRNQTMTAVAASVGSNIKHRMNHMKNDVVGKAIDKSFSSSFKTSMNTEKHDASSSSLHGEGLKEVEKLISQDPDVSKEINTILEQNGQH
ncbi:hypothetical protein [Cohnella sp. WQ 127256]|uniref:hypothetical protein n=1 Tax=Cohnella sp. WQ 127256 TaxID=2938790 RepID=UPI0021179BCE|nr:hypothetical protein [Cohnella sp. WQ 127256]